MRPSTCGSGICWTKSKGARSGALGCSCESATDPKINTVIQNVANLFMFRSLSCLFIIVSIHFESILLWFVTGLRCRFVNSDFGLPLCVTRHRQEVTVKLWYKERSLRAKGAFFPGTVEKDLSDACEFPLGKVRPVVATTRLIPRRKKLRMRGLKVCVSLTVNSRNTRALPAPHARTVTDESGRFKRSTSMSHRTPTPL